MSDEVVPVSHGAGALEPAAPAEPIADPGLPEHLPRPTDVDPRQEKRAERQVAALFGATSVLAILFVVAYFVFDIGADPDTFMGLGTSNVSLGLCLGGAFLCLGIGIIQWARKLMNDHEIVEQRHATRSPDEDRSAALAGFHQGVDDSGIMRRPLIRNSLLGALGAILLPIIVGLRDLGPLPGDALLHTVWRKGVRVVKDVSGDPISVADLELGDLVNAEPDLFFHPELYGEAPFEGAALQEAKAKAAVIVVRMQPDDIVSEQSRNWSYEGILVFSKICTHVGCPISLYEQQTHHLLCPCHQSTFDLTDGGKVVFGPAARPLPQLPVSVDTHGYLVATQDFPEPVGPSFFERNDYS